MEIFTYLTETFTKFNETFYTQECGNPSLIFRNYQENHQRETSQQISRVIENVSEVKEPLCVSKL